MTLPSPEDKRSEETTRKGKSEGISLVTDTSIPRETKREAASEFLKKSNAIKPLISITAALR
jgi:hypothetical protein